MSDALSYNFGGIDGAASFNVTAFDFNAMEAAASRTMSEPAPAIGEVDASSLALSLPAMTLALVVDSRADASPSLPSLPKWGDMFNGVISADGAGTASGHGQMAQQITQSIQQMEQGTTEPFALKGDADGARSGDGVNIGVGELQECTISKATDSASGRQLDAFVITFDRPVEQAAPAFEAQGRLLIGTDDGIWSGGDDDLLIGGQTTWEEIAAGTKLASVTDLVIDPFDTNAGQWEMHDMLIANQDHADGGNFVYTYYTVDTPDGASPATLAEYGLLL